MELSIASRRLLKAKSEIKRDKADDDAYQPPCIQLFGEKVARHSRDHHHSNIINDNTTKPANLRLSTDQSSADHDGDAGLTHFQLQSGGAGRQQQQRQLSLLERQILPGMSSSSSSGNGGGRRSGESGESSYSAAVPKQQLTMFYSGMVNVFDNIPAEKVEAIVLLARESCSPNSNLEMMMEKKKKKKKIPPPLPLSRGGCKLQAAELQLPVARKISLQHFMEKRRLRITSKSPYFSNSFTDQNQNSLKTDGETGKDEEEEEEEEEEEHMMRSDDNTNHSHDHEDHHKISLSPFPSEYFFSP